METKGTGSIVQLEKGKPKGKCRKWQLRVSVGMDPRTGKYRQRTKTFNGTYTEAKKALPRFIEELSGQAMTNGGRIPTFEECAREWLEHRKAVMGVADSTCVTDRSRVIVMCRLLGKRRMDKLSGMDVDEAFAAMRSGDTPSGKPSSPQYLNVLSDFGSEMYTRYAIPMGYASSNPFKGRKSKGKGRKKVALTEEQYQQLASMMRPADSGPRMAVLLGLLAGLRRGECCNLVWGDWDGAGKLHVPGTKNDASDATVPISRSLSEALREWKDAQRSAMEAVGLQQTPSTHVVTNSLFEGMSGGYVTKWWEKERRAIGFECLRFHDLRHAFVARCCMMSIPPKTIQRLARHKTFAVTMDVYAEVTDKAMDDAVAML